MDITIDNYELFFLDYHEGNLTTGQVAELMVFLEEHTDLKDEFENFESLTLVDEVPVSFDEKEALKKEFANTPNIHADNYEEYLVANLESDLTSEQHNELLNFITANPVVKKEEQLFINTRLQPQTDIIFKDKAALKRTAVIGLNTKRILAYASVAASVLVFLFVWLNNDKVTNKQTLVAEKGNSQQQKTNQSSKQAPVTNLSGVGEPIIDEGQNYYAKNEAALLVSDTTKFERIDIMELRQVPLFAINTSTPKIGLESQDMNYLANTTVYDAEFEQLLQPVNDDEDYLSLGQFFSKRFKRDVLKEENPDAQLALIDVVDAGTRGLNRTLGTDMKIDKEYDTDGKLTAYAFSTKNFEFSKPVRRK